MTLFPPAIATAYFLKDGEIKTYLDRGVKNKQNFFADILDVMAKIAEDSCYVS